MQKKRMSFRFTGTIITTFFLCTLTACTGGKDPSVKKEYLEIYYKDGVSEPTAQKLLTFLYPLWRNNDAATQPKTVQLTKTADTVNFRMVIAPAQVSTVTPGNLGAFIQLMSDTIFNGAPVNVVFCDDHFNEQKTLRYSESFRKPSAPKEANNNAQFGTRYHAGTAEVYVQPGVDETFGNKLAKYLDESDGSGELHASFQVSADGNGYIVKMVSAPDFAGQHPASVFVDMANSLSKDVFAGAPVKFILADAMFKDMQAFSSEAK